MMTKRPAHPSKLSSVITLFLFIYLMEIYISVSAMPIPLQNCPLYSRLKSIGDDISFNYTQDMILNPDQYWCDSMPNLFYKENERVEGMVNSFNMFTALLKISGGYFCENMNGNTVLYEQAMKSFKLFSNETLVKKYLVTYLDGLLVEKNYTNPIRYYFYSFDAEISMQDVTTTWDMWVNYFNYFLFCKDNNPYFYEFRQSTLPFIAQFSSYQKVQTLDVLFGGNVAQYCGKRELTFYNRTLLCLCTDYSDSNNSIIVRSMISDKCGGAMEIFWLPIAGHLSLKIIEILLHLVQCIAMPLLCLFPIIFRSVIKWKDHIRSRNTMASVEKMKKAQSSKPQEETSEKVKSDISPISGQTIDNTQCKAVDTPTEVNSQACTSNKNDPNRSSMKEQLSHELIRLICDLKFLTGMSLQFSIFCLLGSAIQHAAEPKGTAAYPTPTLIVASLAFLCVANIPLSGLFVEVLLKLSGNKKKVSIHGL